MVVGRRVVLPKISVRTSDFRSTFGCFVMLLMMLLSLFSVVSDNFLLNAVCDFLFMIDDVSSAFMFLYFRMNLSVYIKKKLLKNFVSTKKRSVIKFLRER